MLHTGLPWSNNPSLLPVRFHYVLFCGSLSSMYEPQESMAISNWQSWGKTMAQTILVEYLIEYHSSVLIKLDRRGQQSERLKCFFLVQNNKQLLHQKIYMSPAPEAAHPGEFVEWVWVVLANAVVHFKALSNCSEKWSPSTAAEHFRTIDSTFPALWNVL